MVQARSEHKLLVLILMKNFVQVYVLLLAGLEISPWHFIIPGGDSGDKISPFKLLGAGFLNKRTAYESKAIGYELKNKENSSPSTQSSNLNI